MRSEISKPLSRLRPLQGDITLRLAIQLARKGKKERARELLDSLVERRVLTEDWVHAVALQERIRSAEDPQLARTLLKRAKATYPNNSRFEIMDVEHARQDTGKADPRTRKLLDTWRRDVGVTPRMRYLQGPIPELEANRERLTQALNRRLPSLASGVRQVASRNLGPSQACGGVWPDLRLGSRSEEGAQGIAHAQRLVTDPSTGSYPNPAPRIHIVTFGRPDLERILRYHVFHSETRVRQAVRGRLRGRDHR